MKHLTHKQIQQRRAWNNRAAEALRDLQRQLSYWDVKTEPDFDQEPEYLLLSRMVTNAIDACHDRNDQYRDHQHNSRNAA